MGMFDRVWVKCPKCGADNEFQTKSGECCLDNYTLEDCPVDALVDVNRHSPCLCECGCILHGRYYWAKGGIRAHCDTIAMSVFDLRVKSLMIKITL